MYSSSSKSSHEHWNYDTLRTRGSAMASAAAVAAAIFLSSTSPSPSPWDKKMPICATEAESMKPSPISNAKTETKTYTSKDVARNNGKNGTPIWMSYGGVVYDVTNFVQNHPGGSEKIMLAAGSAIEPHWHLYRQHFATDLPMKLMEDMAIGELDERDQEVVDELMEKKSEEEEDPYAHEPTRSNVLIVHGDQPMNAEVPAHVLTKSYLTPVDLFYIRHHHPVPLLTKEARDNFKLGVDLSSFTEDVGSSSSSKSSERGSTPTIHLTMGDIKQLPKVEIIATLQCSGNRRGDMNDESNKRTSGTAWRQGAISTAKWGGARLSDVLKLAGLRDPIAVANEGAVQKHVRFESLDGMMASIPMEKATDPFGDVIVAYEMNDEPLPREHGYPLRVIVPGYAAVRNVKWVKKIQIAEEEAEGAWQRGLNYKTLPPNVTDAKKVDLAKMPSMTEVAVFSGITNVDVVQESNSSSSGSDGDNETQRKPQQGSNVIVNASGWAWAGGGRNIVRVDVTGDGGASWETAKIVQGGDQRFGRAWAWVFWECNGVPAVVREDGTVRLSSKAVDLAFNSQPESVAPAWNVRGLGNNSWHSATKKV